MKVSLWKRHLEAGDKADTCAVPHSDCHVRYPGGLRPCNISPHRKRHQASTGEELLALCRILPHGCWTVRWAVRAGCGLCDWNRGRRGMLHTTWMARPKLTLTGRTFVHATVEDLCRHGSDPYFCRSIGSLWVSQPSTVGSRQIQVIDDAYADYSSLIVALILNTRASG
jgi:hypothetical protein